MYKVKEFDATIERRIVIGMVVSSDFLIEASAIFQESLFRIPALRLAAKWCLDFFGEYGEAPGAHFQDIYESHVRSGEIVDTMREELEVIFSQLSEEFIENPQLNVRYLLRQLEDLMKCRSLLSLGEDLVTLAKENSLLEAEDALYSFKPIARAGITWSDPFDLKDSQVDALSREANVLFRLPGAVGDLIGPVERDSFIGIQAPEKRGKTFWLWEFALRAAFNRCNVAFFSLGDLSDVQNWRRVFGWVLKSSRRKAGKEVLVPVLDCLRGQRGDCSDCDSEPVWDVKAERLMPWDQAPDHVSCTACSKKRGSEFIGSYWYQKETIPPFLPGVAQERMRSLSKRFGGKTIRLECHPAGQRNVAYFRTVLDLWEKRDGWTADVVVFDYADIFAPESSGEKETRHQINATWMALRGLSTERSIAVITATQAAKTSYSKSQQDTTDVSEDKRKLGHVTSMLGLNQTIDEKRAKLMRVSQLVHREDDFDMHQNVVVLQCLEMSRPLLASYWLK